MSEEKKTDIQEESAAEVEELFAEESTEQESKQSEEEISADEKLKEAEATIQTLSDKADEMENRYLRLHADFENSRRRARLDLEAAQKYRSQSLATELIQALDNFERALSIQSESEEVNSLRQGLEMVYKNIVEALKKEGVEAIEAVGKEFDPAYHHAVMQADDENYGPNIVVEELQKGYVLKDRVLRPSMVKVNQP